MIYQFCRAISHRGVLGTDDVCKRQVVLGEISSVTIYLKKKKKYLHSERNQIHAGKDGRKNLITGHTQHPLSGGLGFLSGVSLGPGYLKCTAGILWYKTLV